MGLTTEQAYAVLGVEAGATPKEVQLAYRKLDMERHPDRASSKDEAAYLITAVVLIAKSAAELNLDSTFGLFDVFLGLAAVLWLTINAPNLCRARSIIKEI